MEMERRTKVTWGCVLVVLALVAAWFWFGGDPELAKLQAISDQMDNVPAAERDALRDQFRQQMGSLTDDQRRAYFNANRDGWQARQQKRMDDFFGKPKNEQRKELDDMLGRMKQPRTGQPPRGNGGGNRGGRTEAQREERSKRRLDSSTPRLRAQYAEFRRLLNERAQQLGMNVTGGRRGV